MVIRPLITPVALLGIFAAVFVSEVEAAQAQLLTIGDQQLEVAVGGSGEQTIVFESGLGYGHSVWSQVADELGQFAKVVSYSRAGNGKSAASELPRTMEQVATELDSLLVTLDLAPPYILVGHSAGGFYIRKYAELFPAKVQGFVFVDSTPEQILVKLRELDEPRALEEEAVIDSMTPDRVKPENVYFSKITNSGEFAAAVALPDVPTVVITAMKREHPQFLFHSVQGKQIWRELHAQFVAQFSDHLHIVSSSSGHNVHREQPEVVAAAVQYVLRQTALVNAEAE